MLDFYINNRVLLFSKIKKQSIVLLFSNPKNFSVNSDFELNKNFYYLTGISENNVALLMVKDGNEKTETFLFLESPSLLKQKWDGENLNIEKASKLTSIPRENCLDINYLDGFLGNLLDNSRKTDLEYIQNVYLDFSMSHSNKTHLSLVKSHWLKRNYPYICIYDIVNFFEETRVIKTEKEIELIQKAVNTSKEVFHELMKMLKPDIYEFQISAFYDFFLANRSLRSSFTNIVAAGKNATVLHYSKKNSLMKLNDLVLLDLGVNYQEYSSDVARCFPVSGKFSSIQKTIYNIVLDTNKKIIDWLKPGLTFQEMNQYGKNILKTELVKNGFLKENESIEKYCYHGLGHYLGLDVHDVGFVHEPIPENSVITVEPGLYFEEFNLGIRIEDDVLITKEKNIVLTNEIPKEIEEIEHLMQEQK
ncbi:aminopeptidase P N-terminal domain-containing protein ['Camptotheca acuminata' phytoplasma]|uniref:aminopeptidase P N-terminal domain-containing protein n=1 Tax='Camptotheca acuminata' phytoplasma TaxID=3239192 RepID=UPI00351A412D